MSDREKLVFLASGRMISLANAAKLTPYTTEYLSLLARTGKLKAAKINRDWLTTRESVLDYVQKQQGQHRHSLRSLKAAERRLA